MRRVLDSTILLALERSLQGKVEEISVKAGLDANVGHHLALESAGLVH
jgi:hypothetical protein